MNINIENIPYIRIAYIRQIGPYGVNNIRIMEKLKTWAYSDDLLDENSIILGIAQDNPVLVEAQNCRYDTCIVITKDYQIKDDSSDCCISDGCITGGKYAVCLINHTAEAVQKAWHEIFDEISKRDYQLDETRPILERYKAKLVKEHYCEICVPIH